MRKSVSIAPLVLLSAVDHYERILGDSNSSIMGEKRVLGVILGEELINEKKIRISNSFAIPFEEDEKDSDIWFLDHNFIENMMDMFKKINAKEKLLGWYHTGPKLRKNDLAINEMFKRFCIDPLVLVVDVNRGDSIDIPTDCYVSIEEIREDGSSSEKTFIHYPSSIEAEEAEEIGVEHLLRDVKDENSGNLTIKLSNNFKSLSSLSEKLSSIVRYLEKVMLGELGVNNDILGKIQDVFNLLPNAIISSVVNEDGVLNDATKDVLTESNKLSHAFNSKTNDELMIIYVSSLVRSIISLHDLIDNKINSSK